jgi:hypothetical protein
VECIAPRTSRRPGMDQLHWDTFGSENVESTIEQLPCKGCDRCKKLERACVRCRLGLHTLECDEHRRVDFSTLEMVASTGHPGNGIPAPCSPPSIRLDHGPRTATPQLRQRVGVLGLVEWWDELAPVDVTVHYTLRDSSHGQRRPSYDTYREAWWPGSSGDCRLRCDDTRRPRSGNDCYPACDGAWRPSELHDSWGLVCGDCEQPWRKRCNTCRGDWRLQCEFCGQAWPWRCSYCGIATRPKCGGCGHAGRAIQCGCCQEISVPRFMPLQLYWENFMERQPKGVLVRIFGPKRQRRGEAALLVYGPSNGRGTAHAMGIWADCDPQPLWPGIFYWARRHITPKSFTVFSQSPC